MTLIPANVHAKWESKDYNVMNVSKVFMVFQRTDVKVN